MNRKLIGSALASVVILIGLAGWSLPATAGPMVLPPRPTLAAPTATPSALISAAKGYLIRLVADSSLTGLWTSVEWQDALGKWHPVEGWQGTLEPDGTKTWWVAEADRGKGPFRWVIADRFHGEARAISPSFYLPTSNRLTEIKLSMSR